AILKDDEIALPGKVDTFRGRNLRVTSASVDFETDSAAALDDTNIQGIAAANPGAYQVNNFIANVSSLHASGITGLGVVVEVIDSGIRPGFPHISLDGSVTGCEHFVGDGKGCTNSLNDSHGTIVAGMISANAAFVFNPASTIRNAVLAECPACFLNP